MVHLPMLGFDIGFIEESSDFIDKLIERWIHSQWTLSPIKTNEMKAMYCTS